MVVVGNVVTHTTVTGLLVEDVSQFTRALSAGTRKAATMADFAVRKRHRMMPVLDSLLIPELQLLEVLERIDRGQLALDVLVGELETCIGELIYTASLADGKRWLFCVFVDQGEWDYLDCAISPDGLLYFNEFKKDNQLDFYRPSHDGLKQWQL